MTVEQLRRHISSLSSEEMQKLGRELLAVERYRREESDISGFTLEAGLSSLRDAPTLLRQYGVEPRADDLTTLEGMLAAAQTGAFDFVAEDEELYAETDLQEWY